MCVCVCLRSHTQACVCVCVCTRSLRSTMYSGGIPDNLVHIPLARYSFQTQVSYRPIGRFHREADAQLSSLSAVITSVMLTRLNKGLAVESLFWRLDCIPCRIYFLFLHLAKAPCLALQDLHNSTRPLAFLLHPCSLNPRRCRSGRD